MTVNLSVSKNPGGSDKSFYKLMSSELKQMYQVGLLDAPAYVLLIIKTQRKAGWKWTFKVKDFCQEWRINERTFYRAVSKLKSMNLLQWETNGIITVWHGSDIGKTEDHHVLTDTNDVLTDTDDTSTDTDDTSTDTDDIHKDTDDTSMTGVSTKNAETVIKTEVQNSLDFIRSSTDSSESVEEDIDQIAITQPPLEVAAMAATEENEQENKRTSVDDYQRLNLEERIEQLRCNGIQCGFVHQKDEVFVTVSGVCMDKSEFMQRTKESFVRSTEVSPGQLQARALMAKIQASKRLIR